MARTFKGYASAYSADQTQAIRVRRQQVRTLVADFNGAMDPGRTIESVTWWCTSPWSSLISDAAIAADQRSVSVLVNFNYSGRGFIKATVTLDDASQQNYEFDLTVTDCPVYPGTVYPAANGPFSLTATP